MEMQDRFGELPKPVLRLLQVAEIKTEARKCSIVEVKYRDDEVFYHIKDGTAVRVEEIPKLLKKVKGMHLVTAKQSGFAVRRSKLIQEKFLEQILEDIRTIYQMVIRQDTQEDTGNDKK